MLRRCVAVFMALAALSGAATAVPANGRIKICKVGTAEDWSMPREWSSTTTVPVGMEFGDAGTVSDVNADHIKLRVVVLDEIKLGGKTTCAIARVALDLRDEDYGLMHQGSVVDHVTPADGRVLAPLKMFDGSPPPETLYPWGGYAPLEATVETVITSGPYQ